MNWKRTTAAALAAVIASLTAVWAGGLYQTWVGIGWPSYCGGQVTGSTGQICQTTVPAGPGAFTGFETFPADLWAPGTIVTSGGAQSAFANVTQLGQGNALVISNFVSGTTVSLSNQTAFAFISPNPVNAALLSIVAIGLPTTPVEGQIVHVSCVGFGSNYIPSVTFFAAYGQAVYPGAISPVATGQTSQTACGQWSQSVVLTAMTAGNNSYGFRFMSATASPTANISPAWYRFQ